MGVVDSIGLVFGLDLEMVRMDDSSWRIGWIVDFYVFLWFESC